MDDSKWSAPNEIRALLAGAGAEPVEFAAQGRAETGGQVSPGKSLHAVHADTASNPVPVGGPYRDEPNRGSPLILPAYASMRKCFGMATHRILQLGDPVLRSVSQPVAGPAGAASVIRDLQDTLAEFRRAHGFGRGISAVQIGQAVRVIFCLVDGVRFELINPEWVWLSPEKFSLWDDCFSFPGLMVWLERSKHVRLRHQDLDGNWHELEASGAMAELLQHEMDHLDGILSVDHARTPYDFSTRAEWLRRNARPPEYPGNSTSFRDVP